MKKQFSKNEIPQIAKEILCSLTPNTKNQTPGATIVALSGDLGAGKTTLMQSIARELGVEENVISPTFVIMKSYRLKAKDYRLLIHIDAYRLNSHSELERLGWNDLISNPDNLIFIEWPERVPESIPSHAKRISLSHKDDETREIEF